MNVFWFDDIRYEMRWKVAQRRTLKRARAHVCAGAHVYIWDGKTCTEYELHALMREMGL